MGTARIWHYTGNTGEEENPRTRLVREPYVHRQQVTTSETAASSTPAPAGTHFALIELVDVVGVSVRYRVNLPGDPVVDADADDVPLWTLHHYQPAAIHLPPGATVSLIEVHL